MIWSVAEITAALDLPPTEALGEFSGISTDTRSLTPGAVFVALAGERFDAHDFLPQARDAGAAAAVVRHGTAPVAGLHFFCVDDPLVALGRLATWRRRRIPGPVVAVTGTNGKTSTKEMIAAVLRCRWRTHATRENLNNLIGVPLTILGAPADTEALVVEAGANQRGEVARLREIIEPDVGVVTNVGAGHLEGFGTVERVMEEKLSLLDGTPRGVTGIVPPGLPERAGRITAVRSAALDPPAEIRAEAWELGGDGHVVLQYGGGRARLGVPGRHQGDNAMIALAVGDLLGVEPRAALAALERVVVPGGRGSVRDVDGLRILDDTYNANPESMLASLALADGMRDGRPLVIVLGTMLELGPDAAIHHAAVARAAMEYAPRLVGVTGEFIPAFEALDLPPDLLVTADDAEALGRRVAERLRGNELVLLKASHGVRLDRAIAHLTPTAP